MTYSKNILYDELDLLGVKEKECREILASLLMLPEKEALKFRKKKTNIETELINLEVKSEKIINELKHKA